MTTTTKNILSILLFAFSLLFLMAATNTANSTDLLRSGCSHCGSIQACEDGEEAYGYPRCEIIVHDDGTIDCGVMGLPNCVN